jgi:hypothetical protein
MYRSKLLIVKLMTCLLTWTTLGILLAPSILSGVSAFSITQPNQIPGFLVMKSSLMKPSLSMSTKLCPSIKGLFGGRTSQRNRWKVLPGNIKSQLEQTENVISSQQHRQKLNQVPRVFPFRRWISKIPRLTSTLVVFVFLWSVTFFSFPTLPAYASTSATSSSSIPITSTTRNWSFKDFQLLPSASLDQMIDRYVKDHMFDDDVYDPVESAYREAYEDSIQSSGSSSYPSRLLDITSSVLGKNSVVVGSAVGRQSSTSGNPIIGSLLRASQFLTSRFGISEGIAQVVLAVTAFAGSFVSIVSVLGGISFVLKRNLNRELKKRYGDDYRYAIILL